MPSRHRHRKGGKRRRRRARGGQGVEALLHRALLPGALYYLQKQQQRKTRRRNRGALGKILDTTANTGNNILNQATNLVKNAVAPLTKGLKGGAFLGGVPAPQDSSCTSKSNGGFGYGWCPPKSHVVGGGRRRRARRGGQGVQSLVHRALLPGTLYYLQKQQQRKGRRTGRKYRKGSRSKTRKGRQDFLTHLGSNVFDEAGHFVRRAVKPYTRRRKSRRRGGKYRKGSRSKTRKGRLDFLTHLGSNVFDEAGHFVRRAVKPYTRRRRRRRRR